MAISLSELAALIDGNLVGDENIQISDAQPLATAKPCSITFLENDKYLAKVDGCRAAAVITRRDISLPAHPVVQVDDPLTAFAAVVEFFQGKHAQQSSGIDPRAAIHPTVKVGEDSSVAPFAAIGKGTVLGRNCHVHSQATIGRNCRIGDDVTLHPGVVLYEGTIVGNRVVVHANSVIGADGFGYRFQSGRHQKVPQLGNVEIGDDVEIGACTTIDRGTFETTRIGAGTKIDNLVQVAHNCQIGQHNLLVSQMGIAGSSSTGDFVTIAGQVGIVDHAHIGTGAVIGAKAGVTKDVPDGQRMLGAPATPEREQKRILITMAKLPEMRQELKQIKEQLTREPAA